MDFDIKSAAGAAEKTLESIMKFEPTIVGATSMFVPDAKPVLALVQPWVLTVVPFVEKALTDIAAGNGGNAFTAFAELLQHVSKGAPNSQVLAPAGTPPITSAVGTSSTAPVMHGGPHG